MPVTQTLGIYDPKTRVASSLIVLIAETIVVDLISATDQRVGFSVPREDATVTFIERLIDALEQLIPGSSSGSADSRPIR